MAGRRALCAEAHPESFSHNAQQLSNGVTNALPEAC